MKSCSTKTILVLCFSFLLQLKTYGQIIYYDVTPDDSVTCIGTPLSCADSSELDINSDGLADYKFRYFYNQVDFGSGYCLYYIIYRSRLVTVNALNEIAIDSLGALNLSYGSFIDSNLTWGNTINNSLAFSIYHSTRRCAPEGHSYTTSNGNWYNQHRYLGICLIKNGLKYYGWIELNLLNTSITIISAYAFNSIPDQQIRAGQILNGLNGIIDHSATESDFSVFPNPAINEITVYSENAGELQLINNLGQIVFSKLINEIESHINIGGFPSGIYEVRLRKNQTILTKRVAIAGW